MNLFIKNDLFCHFRGIWSRWKTGPFLTLVVGSVYEELKKFLSLDLVIWFLGIYPEKVIG